MTSTSTRTEAERLVPNEPPPVENNISHVSFSSDGSVMATVDVHPSVAASGPLACSLKFWERRRSGASAGSGPLYSLNSHISDPHRCNATPQFQTPMQAIFAE